ncbi:AEC family transporter [Desulfococcaceae bacterium HSG9]|nr:AEC family transporter [Desulfococcaceae bacterium HSG9]
MIVINNLFPVCALLVSGFLLKRFKLTDAHFLKITDRLIYYVFFPLLLFWKIGASDTGAVTDWKYCIAAILAVLLTYLLSACFMYFGGVTAFQAGSFSQSCYRFNSYIGMAVVMNAHGDEGVRLFSLLIGFTIPVINVLAVTTLIWFSSGQYTLKVKSVYIVKALISNPLILACVAGILYSQSIGRFPLFLINSFKLATYTALPLALLSIGGALTFKGLKKNFSLALKSSAFKLFILPLAGFTLFKLMHVTDMAFHVGMIFLALPTSPAIYILSSQLDSDTELATATIVLSTILSIISLSLVLCL